MPRPSIGSLLLFLHLDLRLLDGGRRRRLSRRHDDRRRRWLDHPLVTASAGRDGQTEADCTQGPERTHGRFLLLLAGCPFEEIVGPRGRPAHPGAAILPWIRARTSQR